MNKSGNGDASGGVGFTSLLQIAFIVLKLTHVIDWSWWWVLSPMWITVAIVVVILAVIFILAALKDRKAKKRIK